MVTRKIIRVHPAEGGVRGLLSKRNTGSCAPPPQSVLNGASLHDGYVSSLLASAGPALRQARAASPLHVSDLLNKCARQIALVHRLNMPQPFSKIWDGMGVTYAIGEAVHEYIVERMRGTHPDKVWAEWTCACGATKYVGLYVQASRRKACKHCLTKVNRHKEIPFVNKDGTLQGSPDLLLLLEPEQAFYIVEIKSIAAASWKDLTRCIPLHAVQVAMYWHILKELGIRVFDKVCILYVNKEFSFKSPFKEFVLAPEEVDLSLYWEDFNAIMSSMKGGDLPPRLVCPTVDAPSAKECPVCATCFGISP